MRCENAISKYFQITRQLTNIAFFSQFWLDDLIACQYSSCQERFKLCQNFSQTEFSRLHIDIIITFEDYMTISSFCWNVDNTS